MFYKKAMSIPDSGVGLDGKFIDPQNLYVRIILIYGIAGVGCTAVFQVRFALICRKSTKIAEISTTECI